MNAIEQLAQLSPGGIDPEPRIGSTAPSTGLKGPEVAATMRNLTPFQEALMWVKFCGQSDAYPELETLYHRAIADSTEIQSWLRPKGATPKAIATRIENFNRAIEWILVDHLKDQRCSICKGTGYIYTLECDHCEGDGLTPIALGKIAREMNIRRQWCYDAKELLVSAREILVSVETKAMITINQQAR